MATAYTQAIRNGVRAIADRYAPEIEAYMKSNASWIDRTGNARATLRAEVEDMTFDMVSILLSDGMDYFVFLELGFAGRYQIIAPSVDIFGPRIWNDVRALLR